MPIVYTPTPGSGAIEHIGYDSVTGELRIRFRDKDEYPEYIWGNVEPKIIEDFFLSGSKGKFYHAYIKGVSRYTVRRAVGSYRMSAIIRGLSGAPRRVFSAGKDAIGALRELILPIR